MHGVIKGDVQGVGFRYFLIQHAQGLGLTGWVTNRDDGVVEFIAEGSRPALEQLERAAQQGPRGATVSAVEVNWSAATGDLSRFDIT